MSRSDQLILTVSPYFKFYECRNGKLKIFYRTDRFNGEMLLAPEFPLL